MIKNILLFVFIIAGTVANAQNKNVIYVTLQPVDLGIGLRYDRHFSDVGIYATLTRGNYRLRDSYINNHIRVSAGSLIVFNKNTPANKESIVSCGIVYHHYGERCYDPKIINEKIFRPISIELGVGANVNRFNVGIRIDILKAEGNADFGVSF